MSVARQRARRATPARLLIVAGVLPLAGCTVPVMRPFRTHEGPGLRAAAALHTGAADRALCGHDSPCESGGVAGFSPLNLDARWGTKFGRHVGLMGGLYLPGIRNQKADQADGLAVGYLSSTLQSRAFSFGLSPELGRRAYGMATGFDFRPRALGDGPESDDVWLGLAGHARHIRPFETAEADVNPQTPSWDFGVNAYFGPLLIGYSHWIQQGGVIDYQLIESSVQARSWNIFYVGFNLDRETWPTFSEHKRQPQTPEPPRAVLTSPQDKACRRLCLKENKLRCGADFDVCLGACRKSKGAEACAQHEARQLDCLAAGVACDTRGKLWLPSCSQERETVERCQRVQGVAQ